jgi:hypothetical protein
MFIRYIPDQFGGLFSTDTFVLDFVLPLVCQIRLPPGVELTLPEIKICVSTSNQKDKLEGLRSMENLSYFCTTCERKRHTVVCEKCKRICKDAEGERRAKRCLNPKYVKCVCWTISQGMRTEGCGFYGMEKFVVVIILEFAFPNGSTPNIKHDVCVRPFFSGGGWTLLSHFLKHDDVARDEDRVSAFLRDSPEEINFRSMYPREAVWLAARSVSSFSGALYLCPKASPDQKDELKRRLKKALAHYDEAVVTVVAAHCEEGLHELEALFSKIEVIVRSFGAQTKDWKDVLAQKLRGVDKRHWSGNLKANDFPDSSVSEGDSADFEAFCDAENIDSLSNSDE